MSSREALRELSVALGGFVGEQQGGSKGTQCSTGRICR